MILSFGLHELNIGRIVGEGFEVLGGMDARIRIALLDRLAEEIHGAFFIAEEGRDPSPPKCRGSEEIGPFVFFELFGDLQSFLFIP